MGSLGKTEQLEAIQGRLETSWVEVNVERLLLELPNMAGPTAYFVSQGLLQSYQQKPFAIDVDRVVIRAHVQRTLVEGYLKDSTLLAELVKLAFPSTYAWFAEDMVGELTPESLPLRFSDWLLQRPERLEALMLQHCQHLARSILKALEPRIKRAVRSTWEKMLGLAPSSVSDQEKLPRLLEIMSAAHYYDVREALAHKRFTQSEDSPWPTASLSKGKTKGYAELRPDNPDQFNFLPPEEQKALVESMWRQREELSDIDADALDALSSVWLGQAKIAEQSAIVSVDELLEMRGLLPKKNGAGRRGGYESEQRREILRALSHIQNLWMNMSEVEIYEGKKNKKMAIRSRAFSITDMMGQIRLDGQMDVEQFLFRPGQVFAQFLLGVGRQTALLSARALAYDPYRQSGEKRLTRYLSWQWRCQAGQELSKSYRVGTLLESIGENVREQPRRASRLRDRFEQILERLQQDGVIASWQYSDWDEAVVAKHGWFAIWLQTNVRVEAPAPIVSHYKQIPRPNKAALKLEPSKPKITDDLLAQRLRKKRLALGLSFSQVAEAMGVHRTAVARIEKAQRQPTTELIQKIESWLSRSKGPLGLFN